MGNISENQEGLIKKQKICVEGQNEAHFFENVFTQIVEKGYITQETLQRIQVELLNLWTEQIEAYNAGKSSSIQEKKAKSLMESIYETLGFRLKALEDLDDSIALIQSHSIKSLFEEGQELIENRYQKLKEEYKILQARLLPTENIAYRDTYDEGLAPFFKFYSPKFESHECPCSIDYPLSNDRMEAVGIDCMVDYIEKSLMEHDLCIKFKPEEIEALLEGYHKGYRDLLINIFDLVLMNVIGRLIVGKDEKGLLLEPEDLKKLEQTLEILPTASLEKLFKDKALEILEKFNLTSLKMKTYTFQTIGKFVPRVEVGLEEDNLDKVFIVAKDEYMEKLEYAGGNRLADSEFKTLTEEIRECKTVKDKLYWIQQKVEHAEDLRDILEADCIFEEEYIEIYKSFEDVEIAMLWALCRVDDHDMSEVEVDKEWFNYLKQYLNEMPQERRESILELSHKISNR